MRKGFVILAVVLFPSFAMAQGDVQKGKTIFSQNCAVCHGDSGKGDGPGAAALTPKPRDLTDRTYMDARNDDVLFKIIKEGGTAVGKSPLMPPWSPTLKDQEIRDLISFLRALGK